MDRGRTSRRGLLALGGAVLAGGAAGAGLTGCTDDSGKKARPASDGGGMVPFYGAHQAGITTPAPAQAAFVSFDVIAEKRADLAELLKTITARARFLTSGGTPADLGVGAPPADNGILGPKVAADALRLPFKDDSFDAVTVSFGIRNFNDTVVALREMARVVKPGGRMVICEVSTPVWKPFRFVYMRYLLKLLPLIAKFVSSNPAAYSYLAESMAILHYLAQGSPWWPRDALAQARVLSWLSFEQDRHMKPLAQLRLNLALHRRGDPQSEPYAGHARAAHAAPPVLSPCGFTRNRRNRRHQPDGPTGEGP